MTSRYMGLAILASAASLAFAASSAQAAVTVAKGSPNFLSLVGTTFDAPTAPPPLGSPSYSNGGVNVTNVTDTNTVSPPFNALSNAHVVGTDQHTLSEAFYGTPGYFQFDLGPGVGFSDFYLTVDQRVFDQSFAINEADMFWAGAFFGGGTSSGAVAFIDKGNLVTITGHSDVPFLTLALQVGSRNLQSTLTPGNPNYADIGEFGARPVDLSKLRAVPEPASWALMLIGFFGLGSMLRRRRTAFALA